jgi:Prp8 binding protein
MQVLTFRFDPSGKHCASAGHDKDIFLWEVYGECNNYAVMRGHKQAVLQVLHMPAHARIIQLDHGL